VLEPRITVVQATITLGIALLCLVLALTLHGHRTKSRYPNHIASLVCLALAIWLLLNGIADRISSIEMFIVFTKSTYAYSLLVLLTFLFFILRFPPRTNTRGHMLVLSFPVLVMLISWFLIWHPDHAFTYFDYDTGKLLSEEESPQFYFVIASGLILLATASILAAHKWRSLRKTDQKVLGRILVSFLGTGLIAFIFTLIDAYTGSTPYVFQYAYYGVGIFAITMAHSILRYGDLGTSVTFKRQTLIFGGLATAALLAFISTQKVNELNSLSPIQLTIGSFAIAVLGFILFETFSSKLTHNNKPLIAEATSGDTRAFLNKLEQEYGLSRALWIKRDAHDAINRDTTKLQGNTVDISAKILQKNNVSPFYEPGPARVSLVVPTPQGALIIYRRKYNLSFTLNEFQAIRHEGSLHAAELEIASIRKARGNHVSELDELTQQRKKQLVASNKALSHILQKRAQLFKTVASEIRTPLTLVSSALRNGSMRLSSATVLSIQNESRHLSDLTEELETATQEQRDYLPMREWIEVRHLDRYFQTQHASQCEDKHITLDTSVYPADAMIAIQRIHFDQLTNNLISNAIKYSPSHTRITVTLSVTPGRVVLTVIDEGPGIAPEDRDLIFDPFYRTAHAKNAPGTGLGLSIVKRIAETYNGTARVLQRASKGSVFEIDLSVRTKL
jgi:signal transduction histidine kinase